MLDFKGEKFCISLNLEVISNIKLLIANIDNKYAVVHSKLC